MRFSQIIFFFCCAFTLCIGPCHWQCQIAGSTMQVYTQMAGKCQCLICGPLFFFCFFDNVDSLYSLYTCTHVLSWWFTCQTSSITSENLTIAASTARHIIGWMNVWCPPLQWTLTTDCVACKAKSPSTMLLHCLAQFMIYSYGTMGMRSNSVPTFDDITKPSHLHLPVVSGVWTEWCLMVADLPHTKYRGNSTIR